MASLMKITLAAAFTALAFVGCAKDSSGDGTATAAVSNYTISNGLCFNQNKQVVDSTLCADTSHYYQVNGYCYTVDGYRIEDRFCRQQKTLLLPPTTCEGQFFMPQKNRRAQVHCHDRSCQGNLVFDRNGRPVHCR